MKYTYNKMIKDAEKKALDNNMEMHAIKWMFYNSDFFVGYARLNEEADDNIKKMFDKYVSDYIDKKIPPQYILHKAFFFNYPMYVDEGCFIPRPETEQLVEETIYRIDEMFDNESIDIADVCSGSGAIGLTLSLEIKNSNVYMYELSNEAIEIEKKNASSLGANVTIKQGNFIDPILKENRKFDVIICNPPYIKNDEILDELVVDNEPHMALFGGKDGLDFYRIIFDKYNEILKPGGFMGFEFGYDQKKSLEKLVGEKLKDKKYEFLKDYNGLYRMLFIYDK